MSSAVRFVLPLRAAAGQDLFGPAYGGTQFCIRLSLAFPFDQGRPAVKVTILHNIPPDQCTSCGLSRYLLRWPGSAALPCCGWGVPVSAGFFALLIVPHWPLPSRTQDLFAQDRFRKTFWPFGSGRFAPPKTFPPAAQKHLGESAQKPRRSLNSLRPAGPWGRHAKGGGAAAPDRKEAAMRDTWT